MAESDRNRSDYSVGIYHDDMDTGTLNFVKTLMKISKDPS